MALAGLADSPHSVPELFAELFADLTVGAIFHIRPLRGQERNNPENSFSVHYSKAPMLFF
jgi:hypothetical protein